MSVLKALRLQSSVNDIRSLQLWKSVAAEFLGTFILLFVSLASTVQKKGENSADVVHISLCVGLTVGTVVWSIAHVSGGHINPAVTVGMWMARRVSFVRTLLYVTAQILGSLLAAYIIRGVLQFDQTGVTQLAGNITPGGGIVGELVITFVLVFTVFATTDPDRVGFLGSGPLSIGLSVVVGHLAFVPFTGASMNPARSLGPAIAYGNLQHQWVYWVGPLLGGALAAILYELLFAESAGKERIKALLFEQEYPPPPSSSGQSKERNPPPTKDSLY